MRAVSQNKAPQLLIYNIIKDGTEMAFISQTNRMEIRKPLKILIMDDDPFSIELFHQHLFNLGYMDVSDFQNVIGFTRALQEKPDIIFLDYGIEAESGFQLLQTIKMTTPDSHVVFISGREDVRAACESIADMDLDYIVKGDAEIISIEGAIQKLLLRQTKNKKTPAALLIGQSGPSDIADL
jgi:DNA-binding NtrC family response regulator